MKNEKLKLSSAQESYPGEKKEINDLLADIDKRPKKDQKIILGALERYALEGEKKSYRSDPSELIKYIAQNNLLEGSASIVDLGAGPGDLLQALAFQFPEIQTLGIDLSPSFVRNFNTDRRSENASMSMGLIDSPEIVNRLKNLTEGSVISVLTLDRVADPRQLLKNMSRFKGAKILATILPVVPEDDDPGRRDKKIEYTREENRIVPGKAETEDKEKLLAALQEIWGGNIETAEIPITGESSGGTWQYKLCLFVQK